MAPRKPIVAKFNKTVDTGPLSPDMDPDMQQTIQNERIRRQITAHITPPKNKIAKKKMF